MLHPRARFLIAMHRPGEGGLRHGGLLGDAGGRQEVADAARLHARHPDQAAPDQALDEQVGQPEGDAELPRERSLRDGTARVERLENLVVVLFVGGAHVTLRACRSHC
jgi:hypothetical protein